MDHDVSLLIAGAVFAAPAVMWALWRWGVRRAQRTERREMLRRNKVCRDWLKTGPLNGWNQ
jgi:predicted nucleic acid-binding protein